MRKVNTNDLSLSYPNLQDKHGRQITYLRLSLTNQCNLRCSYCMPEAGLPILKDNEKLSTDEIKRLVNIFANSGIKKIRLTGGEPFIHKDIIDIVDHISNDNLIDGLFITTNGVGISAKIQSIKDKISGINLSLDSVNKERFQEITHRDRLNSVLKSIETITNSSIPLKINSVLQNETTDFEILDIIEYVRKKSLNLRFIEEMPFNGDKYGFSPSWNINKITDIIKLKFTINDIEEENGTNTKKIYIDNFEFPVSFIPAFSRTFCGDCSRIRVTSDGFLKNCLYGKKDLDLKDLLRNQKDNKIAAWQIYKAVSGKLKDGFESEEDAGNVNVSMSMIGG